MRSSLSSIQCCGGDIHAPEASKRDRSTTGPASPTATLLCSRTPVLIARLTRIRSSQVRNEERPAKPSIPRSTPIQVSCTTSSATAALETYERGQAQHCGVMARDERHERLLLACAQPRDELSVLVHRGRGAGFAKRHAEHGDQRDQAHAHSWGSDTGLGAQVIPFIRRRAGYGAGIDAATCVAWLLLAADDPPSTAVARLAATPRRVVALIADLLGDGSGHSTFSPPSNTAVYVLFAGREFLRIATFTLDFPLSRKTINA